ncbi:hypothetical protein YC2023_061655 [Brassica napus]
MESGFVTVGSSLFVRELKHATGDRPKYIEVYSWFERMWLGYGYMRNRSALLCIYYIVADSWYHRVFFLKMACSRTVYRWGTRCPWLLMLQWVMRVSLVELFGPVNFCRRLWSFFLLPYNPFLVVVNTIKSMKFTRSWKLFRRKPQIGGHQNATPLAYELSPMRGRQSSETSAHDRTRKTAAMEERRRVKAVEDKGSH